MTHQRECLFGEVVDGLVRLNRSGEIVCRAWMDLPPHYPYVILDAFICMPNHVHGVIILRDDGRGGSAPSKVTSPSETSSGASPSPDDAQTRPNDTQARADGRGGSSPGKVTSPSETPSGASPSPNDTQTRPYGMTRHGLPEIIRAMKSFSARRINRLRCTPSTPVWQRSYYEHIIRDQNELDAIRKYILNNPLQWELDRENPARASGTG